MVSNCLVASSVILFLFSVLLLGLALQKMDEVKELLELTQSLAYYEESKKNYFESKRGY